VENSVFVNLMYVETYW